MKSFAAFLFCSLLVLACKNNEATLPYLGESEEIKGEMKYYRVPSFQFLNQDSVEVSDVSLAGKAYIADFFFTSCPSICPKVKRQMLKLDKKFQGEGRLKFLSMSVDYRRDSIPVLKEYSKKLDIDTERWHLVQLRKDNMSKIANQYFNVALEDESAPGGFDHSGRLILVDGDGHIRSHCDGTDPESVDKFADDIATLLASMDSQS